MDKVLGRDAAQPVSVPTEASAFESQRDHKLGYSIQPNSLKNPTNIGFAGFFVFRLLEEAGEELGNLVFNKLH